MSDETRSPWEIAKQVILEPAVFFRAMPRGGGLKEPTMFAAMMLAAGCAGQIGLHVLRGSGLLALTGQIMLAFASVVVLVPAIFLAAGVCHLLWHALGSQEDFETSYRCVAYTAALIPPIWVLQALPFPGTLLAVAGYVYSAYLIVPITVEVHHIGWRRVLVVFGTIFLACFVALGALVLAALKVGRWLKGDLAGQGPALVAALQKLGAQNIQIAMQQQGSGINFGAPSVALEAIKALLPKAVTGFTARPVSASRQGVAGGLAMVSAQAVFDGPGGASLEVVLLDSGGFGDVLSAVAGTAKSNRDGPDGYWHAVGVKGWKGYEVYDAAKREGSIQIVGGGRFLVKVSGRNVDAGVIRPTLDLVDLDAVARLKP